MQKRDEGFKSLWTLERSAVC